MVYGLLFVSDFIHRKAEELWQEKRPETLRYKMQKIVDNTKMAKSVWDKFINEANSKKIKKFFHLRPTNSKRSYLFKL